MSDSEEKGNTGFWRGLKTGLGKTRGRLAEGVGNLLLGEKVVNDAVMEDLETALLLTDVGVEATGVIMEALAGRVGRRELNNTRALHAALKTELKSMLAPLTVPLEIDRNQKPTVLLFVGVNGVGKTTTIGKLAKYFQQQGLSVMLAAGDTFRAAAVEQLQSWGAANDVPVVAQHKGADSASVVFDALNSAKARNMDVLIADTAGRLQAKTHLMDELVKIKRVMSKIDASAPHETLLVLDAGVGQNALSQVKEFHDAIGLTGLVLTKLDGSAKAGIIFAISQKFDIPVYFVGVGEQLEDLQVFEGEPFVEALLAEELV